MVESTQLDEKVHIFKLNSPFMIDQKDPEIELRFQVQPAFFQSKHIMVDGTKTARNFEQQIKDYLGSNLPSGFKWIDHYQDNNSVNCLEVSDKYGFMFMIYGQFIFILNGDQIAQIFDKGKTLQEIKPNYYKADGILYLVKVSEKNDDKYVALQEDKSINIYDIKSLVTSLKQQLGKLPAPKVSLKLQSGKYLKQLSFGFGQQNNTKALLVTDTKDLYLYDFSQNKILGQANDITSAVFNQTGNQVLASYYDLENHIKVLDATNLSVLNTISISFSEYCTHDKYRVIYLSDYFGDNLMMGVVGFEDPDKVEENYGFLMSIWVGKNIDEKTTLQDLKALKKIKYYFYNDQAHNNDDNPPAFKLVYINPSQNPQLRNDFIGIFGISQCAEPLTFKISNNDIQCFYDFKNEKFTITYPRGLDPIDHLGIYQGLCLVKFQIPSLPQNYMLNLKDSEVDYKFPPLVMQIGIDGDVKEAMVLYDPWRQEQLLQQTVDINQAQNESITIQQQSQQQPLNGNRSQEESKSSTTPLFGTQNIIKKEVEEEKKQIVQNIPIKQDTLFGQPTNQVQNQQKQQLDGIAFGKINLNQNSQTSLPQIIKSQPQQQLQQPTFLGFQQQQTTSQQTGVISFIEQKKDQKQDQKQTQQPFGMGGLSQQLPTQINQSPLNTATLKQGIQINKDLIQKQPIIETIQTTQQKQQPQIQQPLQSQTKPDIQQQQLPQQQTHQQTQSQQQKPKSQLQTLVERHDQELCSIFNKSVNEMLHQIKIQLPSIESLSKDLEINNINSQYLFDTSQNTNKMQQNNAISNLNLDETKDQIQQYVQGMKNEVLNVAELKEKLQKTKHDLQTFQYNDDFRQNLSGQTLKTLLVLNDLVDNEHFKMKEKERMITIDDKSRGIFEQIDQVSYTSQNLKLGMDQLETILQFSRARQQQLRQQQGNGKPSKFAVSSLRQHQQQPQISQQAQQLYLQNMTNDIMAVKKNVVYSHLINSKGQQERCQRQMEEILYNQKPSDIRENANYYYGYANGNSSKINFSKYDFNEENIVQKQNENLQKIMEEKKIAYQIESQKANRKSKLLSVIINKKVQQRYQYDAENIINDIQIQHVTLSTPSTVNEYLQNLQKKAKAVDNEKLLMNEMSLLAAQQLSQMQQQIPRQQPISQQQSKPQQQQQQFSQQQVQVQQQQQSPSQKSSNNQQQPQKKPSLQDISGFLSNKSLATVHEHDEEHNEINTPVIKKKPNQGIQPTSSGFQSNMIPQTQIKAQQNNFGGSKGDLFQMGTKDKQAVIGNLKISSDSNNKNTSFLGKLDESLQKESLDKQKQPIQTGGGGLFGQANTTLNLKPDQKDEKSAQQTTTHKKTPSFGSGINEADNTKTQQKTGLFGANTSRGTFNLGGLNLSGSGLQDTNIKEEVKKTEDTKVAEEKKQAQQTTITTTTQQKQEEKPKTTLTTTTPSQTSLNTTPTINKTITQDAQQKPPTSTIGAGVFGSGTSLVGGTGGLTFGSTDASKLAQQQKVTGGLGATGGKVFGAGTSLGSGTSGGASSLTFSSFSGGSGAPSQQQNTFPKPQATQPQQQQQQPSQQMGGGSFFTSNQPLFGSNTNLFGGNTNLFGQQPPQQQQQTPQGFGTQQQPQQTMFGQQSNAFGAGNQFGNTPSTNTGAGMFGTLGSQGSSGFFNQNSNMDFGTALQGGGAANLGFSGTGPNLQDAKSKFTDPKFLKARK